MRASSIFHKMKNNPTHILLRHGLKKMDEKLRKTLILAQRPNTQVLWLKAKIKLTIFVLMLSA